MPFYTIVRFQKPPDGLWPVRGFLCDIVLTLVDFVIEALFLQQIAVPALLHNTAVAQNQNEVGIDDRGQAVGDDEAGPA